MQFGTSVASAVLAAAFFAFAAVMQQEAALTVPVEKSLHPALLLELLHRPKWLLGGASVLCGFGLQAVALAFGPVALVQPIIVLELAFAIPFGIVRRQCRAGPREWAGILAVVSGISIFELAANPAGGVQNPPPSQWIESLAPVGVVAVACVAIGATRRGPARAMLLGSAAGLAFGVLSVLTKAVTHLLSADVARAFVTWQIYVAIGVGIVALTVSQSAYQAGPLAYSMPFIGVLEPLVAVVIGDAVLGEAVRLSQTDFALELAAAAVAGLGILLLTTSRTVLSIYESRPRDVPASAS